jgi:hypothetical protein
MTLGHGLLHLQAPQILLASHSSINPRCRGGAACPAPPRFLFLPHHLNSDHVDVNGGHLGWPSFDCPSFGWPSFGWPSFGGRHLVAVIWLAVI